MASRLLNVRLTEEDQVLARELKARGVSISEVVRRALRTEAASYAATPKDAGMLIAEMIERYPTPDEPTSSERPKTTDRVAVRRYVAARLRSRR
jgi:hypothetical protein